MGERKQVKREGCQSPFPLLFASLGAGQGTLGVEAGGKTKSGKQAMVGMVLES